MTRERKDTGQKGEDLAAEYLLGKGYRILCRNYRCHIGEIDLVAEHAGEVVIVEVRTKRAPCMVRPEETITPAKATRLVRLAEHYLVSTGQDERPWRVDVVAIEIGPEGKPVRIEQYQDAVADIVGRL
jgi:putative endonuclease